MLDSDDIEGEGETEREDAEEEGDMEGVLGGVRDACARLRVSRTCWRTS